MGHLRSKQCDAGYSGNDCSLRKCPMGDDPLTVHTIGYDTWTAASVSTANDNDIGKYPVTGTFKLTFTDQFGDEWTTRDIPTQVRLSVPGQLGSEKITFFCQGAGGALETLE